LKGGDECAEEKAGGQHQDDLVAFIYVSAKKFKRVLFHI
jgi:hypothetical protein